MPGEPDPLYAAARSVLLDALEALGEQRQAVILVGAQAIYLYTGSIEFPIAEYTTDADLTLDPGLLKKIRKSSRLLRRRGLCAEGEWVRGSKPRKSVVALRT